MKTHLGSPKYVKVSAVDMTLMQPSSTSSSAQSSLPPGPLCLGSCLWDQPVLVAFS